MRISALSPNKLFPYIILFYLLLGLMIASDFRVGWDGVFQYRLGEANYNIYQHPWDAKAEYDYGPYSHEYHGPFYQTLSYWVKEMLLPIVGEGHSFTVFAYLYFLSFLLGVVCFYQIVKRYLNDWAALISSLLFATQPLLFGHAFINPKDTPFLGLFLASVFTGMLMVDRCTSTAHVPEERLVPWLKGKWQTAPQKARRILLQSLGVWVILWLLILFLQHPINLLLQNAVEAVLQADSENWWGRLIVIIAAERDSVPLAAYAQKGIKIFYRLLRWLMAGGLLAMLWNAVQLYTRGEGKRLFVRQLWALLKQEQLSSLLLAGITLGLTSATRAVAPLTAGGLVFLYFILRARNRAFLPIVVYFFVAGITAFAAWPYMWPAPFSRYWAALTTLSAFPWPGNILYKGAYYQASTLPRDYLPTLMALQFTLPLVILAVIGLIAAVVKIARRESASEWSLPVIWFLLPFSITTLIKPNLYDNFRHLLFITPPLFLFAGLVLQRMTDLIRVWWVNVILVLLVLTPGVYANLRLHPYQYIYYNCITGGVPGAYRYYELDYWATSIGEAFDHLNQEAEPNSRVVVWGPLNTARMYAREDMQLYLPSELAPDVDLFKFDYAVLSSRSNRDLLNATGGDTIFQVEREGAVLMVVRRLASP